MDDKPTCRLAYVKPTVENVLAYSRYRRTQPLIPGASLASSIACLDTPILFGGGRALDLSLLQDSARPLATADLFVLSTTLLLWFDHLTCGLEVPYESIIYHGSLRSPLEKDGHQLSMLITLDRDPLLNEHFPSPPSSESLELVLRPRHSLYDRHYNAEIDLLFNFEDFGVNRGDLLVNNCNDSIATRLEICNVEHEPEDHSDDGHDGLDQGGTIGWDPTKPA